jgi:two-component system LytT family response regulator
MDMIRALVVDDEEPARMRIQELLEKQPDVAVVGTCRDGAETLVAIRNDRPHLLFLDIQMPVLDGFGVIREIGPGTMPITIFVTAYDRYALRAFEACALDYLLKPFSDERFEAALQRARKLLSNAHAGELAGRLIKLLQTEPAATPAAGYWDRIVLKSMGRLHFLETKNVDWIEGAGVYVILHTGQKTYEYRATVGQLEQHLNPCTFVRVHRSAIVKTDRIQELHARTHGDYTILMKSGAEVMLSRAYKSQLEAWLKHPL